MEEPQRAIKLSISLSPVEVALLERLMRHYERKRSGAVGYLIRNMARHLWGRGIITTIEQDIARAVASTQREE